MFSNFKREILNIVNNAPKNFDIIKIHYNGFCKYPNSKLFLCGSSAGYILSKKAALKMSNLKLNYHIDIQLQYTNNINIINSDKLLLDTDENNSDIGIKNFLNRFDNFKIDGF